MKNQNNILKEKTAQFGEKVVNLSQSIYQDVITTPIIHQMVKSAATLTVKYQAAAHAKEQKEFEKHINVCRQETENTIHCLRMLNQCYPTERDTMREVGRACNELMRLFREDRIYKCN